MEQMKRWLDGTMKYPYVIATVLIGTFYLFFIPVLTLAWAGAYYYYDRMKKEGRLNDMNAIATKEKLLVSLLVSFYLLGAVLFVYGFVTTSPVFTLAIAAAFGAFFFFNRKKNETVTIGPSRNETSGRSGRGPFILQEGLFVRTGDGEKYLRSYYELLKYRSFQKQPLDWTPKQVFQAIEQDADQLLKLNEMYARTQKQLGTSTSTSYDWFVDFLQMRNEWEVVDIERERIPTYFEGKEKECFEEIQAYQADQIALAAQLQKIKEEMDQFERVMVFQLVEGYANEVQEQHIASDLAVIERGLNDLVDSLTERVHRTNQQTITALREQLRSIKEKFERYK